MHSKETRHSVKLRFPLSWDMPPRRWEICCRRTTSVSRRAGNGLPPCRQGSKCSMDIWALKYQTTPLSRKFRNRLPVTRLHIPEEWKTQPHRWKKKKKKNPATLPLLWDVRRSRLEVDWLLTVRDKLPVPPSKVGNQLPTYAT